MYKIEITDGINRQVKKLKHYVTREQAEEILEELYENDHLGCSYCLLDENDNEILAFEN